MESGAVGSRVGPALSDLAKVKSDLHAHTKGSPTQNGIAGFACDLFVGAEGAVRDLFGGVVNLVKHPLQSLKGLAMLPVALVTRPADVAKVFTEPYSEAIRTGHPGRAIGRGIIEIGNLVLGVKTVAGLVRGGHAGHLAGTAASAAQTAGQTAGHAGHAASAAQATQHAGHAAQVAGVGGLTDGVATAAGVAQHAGHAAQTAGAAAGLTDGVATAAGAAMRAGQAANAAGLAGMATHVAHIAGAAGAAAHATHKAGKAASSTPVPNEPHDPAKHKVPPAAGTPVPGAAVSAPEPFVEPGLPTETHNGSPVEVPVEVPVEQGPPAKAAEPVSSPGEGQVHSAGHPG